MTAPQPQATPTMGERALEYLSLGYPVFPVCSPAMGQHKHGNAACKGDRVGKTPLVRWEPYQTRLPRIDEVRTWWTRWPEANIGMPTGQVSDVVVLDADSGEAKKLAMERGGLDRTPAVWTGKPGGVHFWLAWPGETVTNFVRKLPNLDFRGDGGYVLVPPSLHASGARYRWVDGTVGLAPAPVPEWLLALLQGRAEAAPEGEGAAQPPHVALTLETIVAGVAEGGRDDALWRLACKLRADNVPEPYARLIVQQAARLCRPPFGEELAVEKVVRAYRRFTPEPTWTFETVPDAVTTPAEPRYPIQHVSALLTMKVEEAACLVDGLVWALRSHWVFSDPNTGKTLLFLAILLHIAAGRAFSGRTVRQGPVLVIEEDSPLSVLAEYVDLLATIYELDVTDLPFWTNRLQGLRLVDQAGYDAAVEAVLACPERPSVVLLDAAERIVPSERFNTRELDWLTRFVQWCLAERITVVVIDHTNRDRPKKGEQPRTPMERLFGARAKSAISDVMLYINGSLKGGGLTGTFAKFRGDAPGDFSATFDLEHGFDVRLGRQQARSPAEQAVMKFFANAEIGWHAPAAILAATGLKDRTLRLVLGALTARGWLIREGATNAVRYRLNPSLGGLFG